MPVFICVTTMDGEEKWINLNRVRMFEAWEGAYGHKGKTGTLITLDYGNIIADVSPEDLEQMAFHKTNNLLQYRE